VATTRSPVPTSPTGALSLAGTAEPADTAKPRARALRFGPFELRPETGELLKNGAPIHLRPQSLQVLALLAERAGELVPREEIQSRVWGSGTFVDFEQGLNHCVKEIRAALGDSAETPTYVATLARRGYRFVSPVDAAPGAGTAGGPSIRWPAAASALFATIVAALALALAFTLKRPSNLDAGRTLIAVMPFENLSGDPDQDYFAAGLTEELTAALGRLEPARLGVVGRVPAMEYRDRRNGLEGLRRDLGVSYLLTGSVRRSGESVRITAALTQMSDKRQVWSEAYDRELRDILSVQRSVAESVGSRILLAFADTRSRRSEAAQVDPEAYTLFLKARYFWNQRDGAAIRKSIDYFEQSIARQPDYAGAYAGLAQAYVSLGHRTAVSPVDAARKAREIAQKALELDGELAAGRVALAGVKGMFEWDWRGAEREFRRALDLNPSDATGHHWYSHVLRSLLRLEEALAEIRTAAALAPLSLVIGTDVGNVLLYKGDVAGAKRQYQSILEMDPHFAPAHRGMGRALLAEDKPREAVAFFEKAVSLSDNPRYQAWLAHAYARAGRAGEARALLERFSAPLAGCAFDIGAAHAAVGDHKQAFTWLERALADHEPALRYLLLDERLEPLRADPAYASIVRRMGLPST
jgi:TolB-like protein/DNA-binding winged helix-turn-helix (wHTH) protein/Tfp pilus assembly protein PilF